MSKDNKGVLVHDWGKKGVHDDQGIGIGLGRVA
jgi:hypothetical protein